MFCLPLILRYAVDEVHCLVQSDCPAGIVKTADWSKYIEYIADSSKRKQQFQSLSPKKWKAPKDQYMFRYYRDHPVALPTPPLPDIVDQEIQRVTR